MRAGLGIDGFSDPITEIETDKYDLKKTNALMKEELKKMELNTPDKQNIAQIKAILNGSIFEIDDEDIKTVIEKANSLKDKTNLKNLFSKIVLSFEQIQQIIGDENIDINIKKAIGQNINTIKERYEEKNLTISQYEKSYNDFLINLRRGIKLYKDFVKTLDEDTQNKISNDLIELNKKLNSNSNRDRDRYIYIDIDRDRDIYIDRYRDRK